MGVTLKQIADLAGVHKSTVDKVLHNRPGVSDAKRQQIRALLDEYGYESNPLGRALNYQKKKMKIAVILPIVDAMTELKRGMEIVKQDFNSFNFEIEYYEFPYPDAMAQARCLNQLREEHVAGVVITPIADEGVARAIEEMHKEKIPVVTVNTDLKGVPHLCFVGQDVKQSGRVAARLMSLLLGGSGVVGVLSSRNSLIAVQERESAFWQSLAERAPDIQIVETVDTQENPEVAYERTCALLDRYPSMNALMITCGCVTDICRAVREHGLVGKMTILCYERYPAIVDLVKKDEIACTISAELVNQGRLAMRLLFEYIIYDRIPESKEIYVKNEILFSENI